MTDFTPPKTVAEFNEVYLSDWALDHNVFIKGHEKHIRQIGAMGDGYYIEFAFTHERKLFSGDEPVTFKHWKEPK